MNFVPSAVEFLAAAARVRARADRRRTNGAARDPQPVVLVFKRRDRTGAKIGSSRQRVDFGPMRIPGCAIASMSYISPPRLPAFVSSE